MAVFTVSELIMDERITKIVETAIGLGRTPVNIWLAVLADDNAPLSLRLAVARDAAPYIHPKLAHSVVEHQSTDKLNLFLADMRAQKKLADKTQPVIDAEYSEDVDQEAVI